MEARTNDGDGNAESSQANNHLSWNRSAYSSNRDELWTREDVRAYEASLRDYEVPPSLSANTANTLSLPRTKQQYDIIMVTAKHIRDNKIQRSGAQLEIVLKVKQADNNPLFDFLNVESELHPFYVYLKSLPEREFWELFLGRSLSEHAGATVAESSSSNKGGNEGKTASDALSFLSMYGDDDEEDVDNNIDAQNSDGQIRGDGNANSNVDDIGDISDSNKSDVELKNTEDNNDVNEAVEPASDADELLRQLRLQRAKAFALRLQSQQQQHQQQTVGANASAEDNKDGDSEDDNDSVVSSSSFDSSTSSASSTVSTASTASTLSNLNTEDQIDDRGRKAREISVGHESRSRSISRSRSRSSDRPSHKDTDARTDRRTRGEVLKRATSSSSSSLSSASAPSSTVTASLLKEIVAGVRKSNAVAVSASQDTSNSETDFVSAVKRKLISLYPEVTPYPHSNIGESKEIMCQIANHCMRSKATSPFATSSSSSFSTLKGQEEPVLMDIDQVDKVLNEMRAVHAQVHDQLFALPHCTGG
jgi:hypothetical protein